MNVFLDANILVSVLNKEYPLFSYTSRILSIADQTTFKLFTSPICLAIAFYFADKKHKTSLAKQKINILCQHISIAANTSENVMAVLANPKIHDFEDGLQYYAALNTICACIVTENEDDFYFSDVEVLNSAMFCKKYLFNYHKNI